MLVTTEQLAAHLNDSSWIIFDCRHDIADHARGARVYAEGHVPGARFAALETDLSGPKTGRNGRHPLPDPRQFADFLARNGVTASTRIVAYDDGGSQYAARLWWLARWIGLTNVAVLDGGYPKWMQEKRPTTKDVPVPKGGAVTARANAAMVVTAGEIVAGLDRASPLIVDARSAERFRGETEPIDPVAGRIPGARNRFFKLNLASDQSLRPAAELKAEFETLLAGRRPEEVAHQCGSGVSACVNLLAMEAAGLTGSRLYVGSWSEWIADPAHPIAQGR